MKIKRASKVVRYFIPLAIAITVMCGLVYVTVQQNYRHSANDPQIQLAEDTARELNNQQYSQAVVPPITVDIGQSLAPYIMVFDTKGKIIASQAQLNEKTPIIPSGVFDYVRQHGENKFTWQPTAGVRSAVVVTKYNNGFVLAGRSLREVEKREDDAEVTTVAVWIFTLVVTGVATFIFVV